MELHKAQASVLFTLRHATRARYSELLRPTGLDGDIFKYHLRKLVRAKYVIKAHDGMYELSAEGKELANRMCETTGREIEQPKSSMLMVLRCNKDDKTYYLAHQRKREPFRDFWGIASAPVLRGVPVRESAAREVAKQTGLHVNFHIQGSFRVIDTKRNGDVLEDKLFMLMYADLANCQTPHEWYGGVSRWMTRAELLAQDRLFPTTEATLDMIEQNETFREAVCAYRDDEY